MAKFYYFIAAVLLFSSNLYPQAPFTTLMMEPTHVTKVKDKYIMYNIVDSTKNGKATVKLTDADLIKTAPDDDVDFFKNNSLALSIINNGENRLSINSQVIFYKINILTPIEEKTKNFRYNIPFMLISKLSTSYDSISGANSIDVLDYEAAPVTLRIMPSVKLSGNDTYKEKLFFGFYTDARGLNLYQPETGTHKIEVVGSGGLGLTLQGDGEAGLYNSNGEYEPGKWLLSCMFQGAVGKDTVIQSLFKTEKDYVTSFQSYFTFKVSESSKFNLKIAFQHYFQETITGSRNNFSVGIGI